MISAAVARAQRLVADGLDLCIARTGRLVPRRSTILASALLDRAVAAVARSAADRKSAGNTFSVAELGSGVPPEPRLRVFEPFVSLEAGKHHRGLGLAFCKTAAEAHGGRVWVDEEPSRGSRLRLFIPSDRCEDPSSDPVDSLRAPDSSGGVAH